MPYGTSLINKNLNYNKRFGLSNLYHQSVWKTDNTSTGSSNNNQVKLPLESTGTYNFVVDWGDGNKNTITAYNQAEVTHTYSVIGTYTIKIIGTCVGFRFNGTGDRLKILDIQHWGKDFQLGNSNSYFYKCENLNITAKEMLKNPTMNTMAYAFRSCNVLNAIINLDMQNVTNMNNMHASCSIFNQPVNYNTQIVTDMGDAFANCPYFNQPVPFDTQNTRIMDYMYYGCSAFNQDISHFSLKSLVSANYMLHGATAWSRANYDAFLISAYNQALTTGINNSVQFRCSTKYTAGGAAEAARTYLQNTKLWTIIDAGPF